MPLNVVVSGTSIPTEPAALKDLRADLNLAFALDTTLLPLLATTLDKVPASSTRSVVSYTSPALSWSPEGSAVTFGLQGGASGVLEIVTAGDLLTYTDGLNAPETQSVTAVAGTAYVRLTLGFSLAGNAAGTYSGGAYGVKAGGSAATVYNITFAKAFASSTTVRDAIAQTFEAYTLPLHPATLRNLNDGDFLLYRFDGNVHLSFGAYAGLSKVLYAGQSSVDVVQSFGSPLARLSVATKPTVTLGTKLDFALAYATQFEALLSKSAGLARMHLFRASTSGSSTTLKAGMTFDGNTTALITPHVQTVADSLVHAAGSAGALAQEALKQVLSQTGAVAEIDKYLAEVNDKLTSWLNRANGVQANLQAAIESSGTRTVLAGYAFDLASPAFDQAWELAAKGDFVEALATGSVTLDVGSGLEKAYQRNTSFACHFFNLWSLSTWSDFQSKTSLVYAGNNVFHLRANVGRTVETQSMGAMRSLNVYFAASADAGSSGALSSANVDLHLDLTAQAEPKAAMAIAMLLLALGDGPRCDALGHGMRVFAANAAGGTAQLQVTVPASAYSRLRCDPYIGSKPQTTDNTADAANWDAFAKAAEDLNAWVLAQLSVLSESQLARLRGFAAWAELNQAANGATRPNRVQVGNTACWPADFPQVSTDVQTLIVYSMLAGAVVYEPVRRLARAGCGQG